MKRVRWLSAHWPVSMTTLAGNMSKQLFTVESFDGFIIDRIRDNLIEGSFVEKLSYQEKITDPFGNEQVFDRVTYRNVEFTLHSEFPNIELRNAHKNARLLISKLLELCNFSVAIVPVKADLLKWVEAFQEMINQKLLIDSLQISEFQLEAGVSAKILIKGDRDVIEALSNLSGNRKFLLDKVQVKIPRGHKLTSIQMASNGTVTIPDDYFNDFSGVLRDCLAKANKP